MKRKWSVLFFVLVIIAMCYPAQAEAAKIQTITSVDISFAEPQVGQLAGSINVTTNTPGVKITEAEWWCNINVNTKVDPATKFQPGVKYYLSVRVETTGAMYIIDRDNVQVNFNGTKQDYFSSRATTNVVANSVGYTMPNATVISSINISFAEPQVGQLAGSVNVTTNTPGVKITDAEWWCNINVNTKVDPATKFQPGVKYYLSIRVETTGTMYIIDRDNIRVNFNGTKQDYFSSRATTNVVANSVGYTMPTMTTVNSIESMVVTLGNPEAGQIMANVSKSLSTVNATITEARWFQNEQLLNASTTFKAGETYVCVLTIHPQKGYTLENIEVTLNGAAPQNVAVLTDGGILVTSKPMNTQAVNDASAPQIITQPVDQHVKIGETAELAVTADSTDGGVLSYQWYVNASKQNTGGTSLGGAAQSAKYAAPSSAEGVKYYYCVVTNTDAGASGSKTAMLASNAAAVEVSSSEKVLKSIIAPDAITNIANGSAKAAAALKLPATVTMVTDSGQVSAAVTWNVSSSQYDVAKKDEQSFTVSGTVSLPSGVLNSNNVSLSVEVRVTVAAASAEEYTIRYHANGGIGSPPTVITVTSGASHTIMASMFTLADYTFSGWGTTPAGGTLYAVAATIKVEANMVLYAQWMAVSSMSVEDTHSDSASDMLLYGEAAPGMDTLVSSTPDNSYESATLVFTIGSKIVLKNGSPLPELDVSAMIINGRTMIPFRYFIETALGGVANFDASSYTITATVNGHTIVMVIDDLTIYVDGKPLEMSQAPTIVDSRTLVPLRLVETMAKSVGWDSLTRKATIIL